jgi:hypothetical protein
VRVASRHYAAKICGQSFGIGDASVIQVQTDALGVTAGP